MKEISHSTDIDFGKVSIICPVYNDALFLRQTLNSIFNQTYTDFEILIVDDASTDDSFSIASSFHDKRARIFKNKENKGAAFSRNLALSMAAGVWIAFLDGDDVWVQDKLEKHLKFMVTNNYAFSYTKYMKINELGQPENIVCSGPKKIGRFKMVSGCFLGCLTVIYKRSLLPNLKVDPRIKKRNDYAIWLQLSKKSTCYLFDQVLAYYRERKGSLSRTSRLSLLKHHYLLFRIQEHMNPVGSFFFAGSNAFNYFVKKILYTRRIK